MRGVAMILVIVQHAYHLIDPSRVYGPVDFTIYGVTKMASVAFMGVSGMMIGYFLYVRPDWRQVQRRFARRAVFLILFAHPAIATARYFYFAGDRWHHYLHSLYYDYPITDTIGLCLLIAPAVMHHIRPMRQLVLIVVSLLVTPLIVAFWQPGSSVLVTIKAVLFGTIGSNAIISFGWPLVPWLAIFLCGSFMGKGLASARSGKVSIGELSRRMRRWAVALFVVGLILAGGYKLLKMQFGDTWDPSLFHAIYPSRTTSLLPVYLAILLWVFSLLMSRVDLHGRYDRLAWAASVFGRTSLFTYIVQFLPVHSLPGLLGLKGHLNLWQYVVLAAFALVSTWLMSYGYGRLRGWVAEDDYARVIRSLREQVSHHENASLSD
jgi:uncharacterized membrane protein